MNRRDFQTGLLATGLAGALPAAARASNAGDRESPVDRLTRVRIQLLQAVILLEWLLIVNQNGVLGLSLSQPAPRFDTNRADLGRVPILGQFQRPVLAQRFAQAVLVGQLVLLNRSLILLPILRQNLARKSVVIAHRDEAWEPRGRTEPVRISGLPDATGLAARDKVGTAHLQGDELLLIVRPSIVALPDG